MLPLFLSSVFSHWLLSWTCHLHATPLQQSQFTLTSLLNFPTACLPLSCSPNSHDFKSRLSQCYPNPLCRINQHLHSSIPHAGKLWKHLSFLLFFPPVYDLTSQKRESRHFSILNWSLFAAHLYLILLEQGWIRFFLFAISFQLSQGMSFLFITQVSVSSGISTKHNYWGSKNAISKRV